MRRGFATILIIPLLIIILLAGLVYWRDKNSIAGPIGKYFLAHPEKFTPIPLPSIEATDETANWKTYESSKKGYIFKYPAGWRLSSDDENATAILDPSTNTGLRISIQKDVPKDLNAWLNILSSNDLSADKYIESRGITIGGEKAFLVIFETQLYSEKNPFYVAIVIHNNIPYHILNTGNSLETFNQIRSTFKFVD